MGTEQALISKTQRDLGAGGVMDAGIDIVRLCADVASRVSGAHSRPPSMDDAQAKRAARLVFGRSRVAEVCAARHVVAAVLRRAGWSYPLIGKALRRDHSTIIHAVRKVDESPRLRRLAAEVEIPYLR